MKMIEFIRTVEAQVKQEKSNLWILEHLREAKQEIEICETLHGEHSLNEIKEAFESKEIDMQGVIASLCLKH